MSADSAAAERASPALSAAVCDETERAFTPGWPTPDPSALAWLAGLLSQVTSRRMAAGAAVADRGTLGRAVSHSAKEPGWGKFGAV